MQDGAGGVSRWIDLLRATGGQVGGIRLHTLVMMRWMAVCGQTGAVLIVYFGLGYDLNLWSALATICVSFLLNVHLSIRYPAAARLNENQAMLHLTYDTVQLVVLLFLTGGLHNPFSFLMLAPALIAATVLSVRATALLIALVLLSVSALVFYHLPLPWSDEPHKISHTYVLGIWTSIVIGVFFFSANVMRVAGEKWRVSSALMETQIALAREQRLSAIGGMVAAAAHELGTPLGTIALVAKELSREFPKDSPHAEDIDLLVSQSERCRHILEQLTMREHDDGVPSFRNIPLMKLLELATRPHKQRKCVVSLEHDGRLASKPKADGGVAEPVVGYSHEFIHGIGNLVENAVDFADSRISIKAGWSETAVAVEITDDGPGFEPGILKALGDPYVSSRHDAGGMGLGVFISKTLLERTGAAIEFDNPPGGGARITVTWRRPLAFEVSPEDPGATEMTGAGG